MSPILLNLEGGRGNIQFPREGNHSKPWVLNERSDPTP